MYEYEADNPIYPMDSVIWQQQQLACQPANQPKGCPIHRLTQAPNVPPR